VKRWEHPNPKWDCVWNAWFMFRASQTLREASYWLSEFQARRRRVKE
jgi:hypothetical protein